MIRLDKFLCETAGYTRTEAKAILKKGIVSVNGITEKKPDCKIREDVDQIKVSNTLMQYEKNHYYLLHKPAGVITATEDKKQKTVLDLLKDVDTRNLFPVGRLDKDTEGLLLITDDGELAHRLLSPKFHVKKTYYVRLRDELTQKDIECLEKGIDIGDDSITLPAKINMLNQREIELTICEGRYHQVKRMLQAVGNKVIYLKRLSMGSLYLTDDLEKGMYRKLSFEEINSLKELSYG